MAKLVPNQLKMFFDLQGLAAGTQFLDLSQCASLLNRKFLRQGLNWVVSDIEIISDVSTQVVIHKLPTTWPMANAWVKSFHLWRDSLDQVLDIDGHDIEGKYADFKIFYDSTHEAAGVSGNLLPNDLVIANADGSYDWEGTIYEVPNDPVVGTTTGYNIHAIGPSVPTSKGMIAGYAASRRRPQAEEPNIVDVASPEMWMRELFDVGDNLEEIREDIETLNDQPPYLIGNQEVATEFYPGGSVQGATFQSWIQDVLITRTGTSLAMDSSGPFIAPCGLLRLQTSFPAPPGVFVMSVSLSAGPVKGFLAEPMQEMN